MSYEIMQAICESAGEMALVTVMDTNGSVPRHAGSKMLVNGAGRLPWNGRRREG